jgi:YD repeat-containing protein
MCDSQRQVVTLDVATGKKISSFSTIDSKSDRGAATAANLCLSPDDTKLAMASRSGLGVDIWDPKTGRLGYSLPDGDGTVYWLAWNPDGQRLAVSRSNGDIAIWNLKDIQQVLTKIGLNL